MHASENNYGIVNEQRCRNSVTSSPNMQVRYHERVK